ncbi:hypothetical protein [Amycolatopsis taiwanensis]|nr:hypothetical protein [Amycolatopsis taiwanensis]
MTRILLGALAAAAAVVLIALAASWAPDVPPACHIPGHARTTVQECEGR